MKIPNIINDRLPTDYILSKNPYATKHVSVVELKQSTSVDGWKYHKHNKRKK